MSFATTDERVQALRQLFEDVLHNAQLTVEARGSQLKYLIHTNHQLPHSRVQQTLEDDLLEALPPAGATS